MQRIGRYEVIQELGRGAMGVVYKARDPQIGRTVAIKSIIAANLPPEELVHYKERFYREARAAGQMSHPGIVAIHDIAEDESGHPYLVMEFVDGVTLHRMLRPNQEGKLAERLPLEKTLDIAAQVAEALDYAHKRGVVHRDVKPGNILITPEGRAKITDFGIAKFTGTEATHTATVQGTPSYMAPEQFRGGAVDARSDIFSLGAMLYWMCTGEKPFPGADLTEVSFKVVYTEPLPVLQVDPTLPAALDLVLSRCLAKVPGNRYASAHEMAEDLLAVKAGRRVAATYPPMEPTVEETVTRSIPAVPIENMTPVAPRRPAAPAAAPAKPSRKGWLVGVAAVVLLAAAAAYYFFFWPGRAPEQASTQPAQQATAPAPGVQPPPIPAGTPSQPEAGSATPAPATAVKPAGKTTLEIECKHNFKEATLQVFSAGRKIFEGKLEGKPGLFGKTGGTLQQSLPAAAGARTYKVRVTSPLEKYEEEQEIKGTLTAGQTSKLLIQFGKGSGAGFSKRKLTLEWK